MGRASRADVDSRDEVFGMPNGAYGEGAERQTPPRHGLATNRRHRQLPPVVVDLNVSPIARIVRDWVPWTPNLRHAEDVRQPAMK
jgi:hypothetical protein